LVEVEFLACRRLLNVFVSVEQSLKEVVAMMVVAMMMVVMTGDGACDGACDDAYGAYAYDDKK